MFSSHPAIFDILPVHRTDIYGFHREAEEFWEISLTNPADVARDIGKITNLKIIKSH
jgi:hypothetical protein